MRVCLGYGSSSSASLTCGSAFEPSVAAASQLVRNAISCLDALTGRRLCCEAAHGGALWWFVALSISTAAAAVATRAVADPAPAAPVADDPDNNGSDITRPQNGIETRLLFRDSSGSLSRTRKGLVIERLTSKIELPGGWRLGVWGQGAFAGKADNEQGSATWTRTSGLGDTTAQLVLARALDERWAFGVGARLTAPTADDSLGTGKWQIMPGAGVRYTFPGSGLDTYFAPQVRFAMSFAGDPSRRSIREPQIAPTLNIELADHWYVTLYPSNDIRINLGAPVSGQTGRLFLPIDAALGRSFDRLLVSLEASVPIVKDYPVYDFKTEIRFVVKF